MVIYEVSECVIEREREKEEVCVSVCMREREREKEEVCVSECTNERERVRRGEREKCA